MTDSHRIAYQQGDHVCALYTTPEQQMVAAIEYIRQGLSRNERCLYVCGQHSIGEFSDELRKAGIDVDAEIKRGALILTTKHGAHLRDGYFDPDKMISLLYQGVKEALDAGFEGLAAAGDMSWTLDNAPGTDKLSEYEARLNHFYKTHRALGLCLYNRSTLPADVLDHGIATHRFIRIDGPILLENPFYEAPEIAATRTASSDGLSERMRVFET